MINLSTLFLRNLCLGLCPLLVDCFDVILSKKIIILLILLEQDVIIYPKQYQLKVYNNNIYFSERMMPNLPNFFPSTIYTLGFPFIVDCLSVLPSGTKMFMCDISWKYYTTIYNTTSKPSASYLPGEKLLPILLKIAKCYLFNGMSNIC